jgi:hypothetical protein
MTLKLTKEQWKFLRSILPYDSKLKEIKNFDELAIESLKRYGILELSPKEKALNYCDEKIEIYEVESFEGNKIEWKEIKEMIKNIKESS